MVHNFHKIAYLFTLGVILVFFMNACGSTSFSEPSLTITPSRTNLVRSSTPSPINIGPTLTGMSQDLFQNQEAESQEINATNVTPISPSICPTPDPELAPEIQSLDSEWASLYPDQWLEATLEFLNRGGLPMRLLSHEWFYGPIEPEERMRVADLTNDTIPEILIGLEGPRFVILGCTNQAYEILFNLDVLTTGNLWAPHILQVEDLNENGTLDVLLVTSGRGTDVQIIEWDGYQFSNLLRLIPPETGFDFPPLEDPSAVRIFDINQDGILDILLDYSPPLGSLPAYFGQYPWRSWIVQFIWDGSFFVPVDVEYSPPIYRFQALFDADQQFTRGKYGKAISLYERVIHDDTLMWWSDEGRHYVNDWYMNMYNEDPTQMPPQENPAEYLTQAAYARYRLALIYLTIGEPSKAEYYLKQSQDIYQPGMPGYLFLELSNVILGEYSLHQDIGEACIQATTFAQEHQPMIVEFLPGSTYAGYIGDYAITELCPLK